MKQKLAIIGNGFDLAHGLKTDYYSFFNQLPVNVQNKWKSIVQDNHIAENYWYSFEEVMDLITKEKSQNHVVIAGNNKNQAAVYEELEDLNSVFQSMNKYLLAYMSEINSLEKQPLKSIQDFFNKKTSVINFNYTNTAELYHNDVYYAHGSVNENRIILGYKTRNEPAGAPPEYSLFSKEKLREKLNFFRFLLQNNVGIEKIEKELNDFDQHVETLFSGRGGYNFNSQKGPFKDFNGSHFPQTHFDVEKPNIKVNKKSKRRRLKEISPLINEYGEKHLFSRSAINTQIDFSKIKVLGILGHSLHADEELFESLFKELTNLKEVILFTYKGENKEDLKGKKRFIKAFTGTPISCRRY